MYVHRYLGEIKEIKNKYIKESEIFAPDGSSNGLSCLPIHGHFSTRFYLFLGSRAFQPHEGGLGGCVVMDCGWVGDDEREERRSGGGVEKYGMGEWERGRSREIEVR